MTCIWVLPSAKLCSSSASVSVISLRCSLSIVPPNSRVFDSVMSFFLRRRCLGALLSRYFTKGRVPPPSTMVVKSTTIRVVVTSTFLTWVVVMVIANMVMLVAMVLNVVVIVLMTVVMMVVVMMVVVVWLWLWL